MWHRKGPEWFPFFNFAENGTVWCLRRKEIPSPGNKNKNVHNKLNSKLEKNSYKNQEYSVDITFQINLKTKTTFVTVKYI